MASQTNLSWLVSAGQIRACQDGIPPCARLQIRACQAGMPGRQSACQDVGGPILGQARLESFLVACTTLTMSSHHTPTVNSLHAIQSGAGPAPSAAGPKGAATCLSTGSSTRLPREAAAPGTLAQSAAFSSAVNVKCPVLVSRCITNRCPMTIKCKRAFILSPFSRRKRIRATDKSALFQTHPEQAAPARTPAAAK